jgi:hypothetical protein
MNYPKSKEKDKSQTVRIARGLKDSINEFLKTKKAHDMGLDNDRQVIDAAVRALLERYHFELDDKENIEPGDSGESHLV